MAANHNRSYNRRNDQTATYPGPQYQQGQMRMQGGQGPAAQALPMNYQAYGMTPHGAPFHQMAQQHMPQQMAYTDGRHGQVNPAFQLPHQAFVQNYSAMQGMPAYGQFNPTMQPYMQGIPHQMMTQTQQSQPQPHPMTQHPAHTSATPPVQQQQQPSQHQPVSQPLPKPKNKAIKIIDPNTLSEVDVKAPAAPSSEPQEAVQTKEKRNHFKEQVLQTVKSKATTPEPAKSAPHAPAQKTPQTSTPVKVSQPATAPVKSSPQPPSAPVKLITPVEIKKPVSTPAAPVKSATDPAKTVTPKSILPRTSSQTDDKTPEKQGIEISVQTTPSLAKTTTTPTSAADKPEIAAPKFESPPQPEAKIIEKKAVIETKPVVESVETDGETIESVGKKEPLQDVPKEGAKQKSVETKQKGGTSQKGVKQTTKPKEVAKPKEEVKQKEVPKQQEVPKQKEEVKEEVKQKEDVKQEVELKPKEELMPKEEVKPKEEAKQKEEVALKEEVIEKDEAKVNGVQEKKKKRMDLPIYEKEILPQEDLPSSEESSESKEHFETPPATPSDLNKEKPPKHEPVVKPDVTPEVPAAAPVKQTEEVSERKVEEIISEDIKIPEISKELEERTITEPPSKIDVGPELEEGELEEEITPTGHFRYTREEMVALRESQDKPLPDIPRYECVMEKPILKAEPVRPRPSNAFVPTWEKEGGRNRSRGGGDRNRSMDKNMSQMNSMKPRIIEHTLAPAVTRKKSSNAWLSKREETPTPKDLDAAQSGLKILRGNIVAILNKITPQNFKDLSVQILQLGIDNLEKLDVAVEIIFEKAVHEPAFSQTYANLCKIMGSIKIPEETNERISPFRRTLLNRCQKEFFREKTDEDAVSKKVAELKAKTDLTDAQRTAGMEELLYQKGQLKKKMLGNINFIGELFNLGMLSSKIILTQCIANLLNKKDPEHGDKVDDEVVECLSKLYTTVGKKLEDECNDEQKKNLFDRCWNHFKSLSTDPNYPYRIRFMIQDVMELRNNQWVPRRAEAKPQRIEDIHREHAQQEHEKKMEATLAVTSNRKTKSRNDSRDERGGMSRNSRDGRDKEYIPKKINTPLDFTKIQSQKLDSGSLVLGPSVHKWGRGSGTGSGTNSPLSGSKEDLSIPTNNRFDMSNKGPKQKLVPGRTSSAPAPRKNMMDRERASALASAHAIAVSGRRTPSQSPVRTPSHSPVRAASQPKDLSDDEIAKKTKSIVTEFFDIEDLEEAVDCVKEELKLEKKHHIFVQSAVQLVVDAKSKNIKLLGELFAALFKEKLLNADDMLTGFQRSFESAQDLAIDVPAIYSNLGKLMGESFAQEYLTFKVIKGALGPLKESDKAGVVMCEGGVIEQAKIDPEVRLILTEFGCCDRTHAEPHIIKASVEVLGSKGSMEVQRRWGKDKMSWSELCVKPAELIEKYKLDFLSSATEPKDSSGETDIDITQNLRALLQDEKKSKDDVFTYIDKTVSVLAQKEEQFIKDVMTVVCEFCFDPDLKDIGKYTLSDSNFSRVSPILMKYLQSDKDNLECELFALDAVQLLMHNMKHPRSLAHQIFVKLDDGEIVTEGGFRHWRENGREQQGHGVMRSNLKMFFEDLSNDSDSDNSETAKA